jgi:hypothetical protein
MMTSPLPGMLIHIGFPRRDVPSLLQQALGPNVHEHYVELRLRTYRLFVLQPELNLIQILSSQEKETAAITLSNANLQRGRCAVSPRADVEEVSCLSFVMKMQKGSHGES